MEPELELDLILLDTVSKEMGSMGRDKFYINENYVITTNRDIGIIDIKDFITENGLIYYCSDDYEQLLNTKLKSVTDINSVELINEDIRIRNIYKSNSDDNERNDYSHVFFKAGVDLILLNDYIIQQDYCTVNGIRVNAAQKDVLNSVQLLFISLVYVGNSIYQHTLIKEENLEWIHFMGNQIADVFDIVYDERNLYLDDNYNVTENPGGIDVRHFLIKCGCEYLCSNIYLMNDPSTISLTSFARTSVMTFLNTISVDDLINIKLYYHASGVINYVAQGSLHELNDLFFALGKILVKNNDAIGFWHKDALENIRNYLVTLFVEEY